MIAIIDYGVGNLFSLRCSLASLGQQAVVTRSAEDVIKADKLLLPGVGAFGDAAKKLRESGMVPALLESVKNGRPLLGVCLGMQMLFDTSFEYGAHKGLGLIPGEIRPIAERVAPGCKIPHMGWNALRFTNESPLFRYINDGDCVYFVHSYSAVTPPEYVVAETDHGGRLTAAVQRDNVFGCQFHPEKSGGVGLAILRAFCEYGGEAV